MYMYVCVYIYIYIYIYNLKRQKMLFLVILPIWFYHLFQKIFRYSDFYVKLHLIRVPASSMEEFFFQKEPPKSFSWGRPLGKIYVEGYMEGLMIRSYEGRGNKMYFPIICKSINCKSFPQSCWYIQLNIKLCQELRKGLIFS